MFHRRRSGRTGLTSRLTEPLGMPILEDRVLLGVRRGPTVVRRAGRFTCRTGSFVAAQQAGHAVVDIEAVAAAVDASTEAGQETHGAAELPRIQRN